MAIFIFSIHFQLAILQSFVPFDIATNCDESTTMDAFSFRNKRFSWVLAVFLLVFVFSGPFLPRVNFYSTKSLILTPKMKNCFVLLLVCVCPGITVSFFKFTHFKLLVLRYSIFEVCRFISHRCLEIGTITKVKCRLCFMSLQAGHWLFLVLPILLAPKLIEYSEIVFSIEVCFVAIDQTFARHILRLYVSPLPPGLKID